MEKSTFQLLQEARALVAAPGGWTQRVYRRAAPETGSHAYCAVGAVLQAVEPGVGSGEWNGVYAKANPALAALFAALSPVWPGGVSGWNEVPGRTQAEVVALFDRALTLVTK